MKDQHAGTEPSHVCCDGATPSPYDAPAKKAAAAVAEGAPKPAAVPTAAAGTVDDGQTFGSLDSKPQAQPT